MPKNDLRVSEKQWRRKRLFREQRSPLIPRLFIILGLLALLLMLGWWLGMAPSSGLHAGERLP